MKVTRIYTDTNGDSRFEDIKIDLFDRGEIGRLSENIEVKYLQFRTVPSNYDTTNFCEHDNMGVPYDLTIKNKYCRMENCFPEYSNS